MKTTNEWMWDFILYLELVGAISAA